MGPKRDLDALTYSDNDETALESSNKRQRSKVANKDKRHPHQPATDPTYGQRCVFPGIGGTTVPSDDDLDFEDEGDALAYLEAVRLEAGGIPHIVIAPKSGPQLPPSPDGADAADRDIYSNGVGDSRGYYRDGAYTAAPDTEGSAETDLQDGEDDAAREEAAARERLCEAYYASLISHFMTLREQLHQDPPFSAIDALPPKHETEVGPFGRNSRTFHDWTDRLRYTDPLPAQMAAMDKASVLKLLRIILGGKFLRRGYELRERTSRWIWSLLARLPHRGEMDSVEVGWVRELGKRAVLMLVSIAQMAALREELEDDVDEDDGEEDAEDDVDQYEGGQEGNANGYGSELDEADLDDIGYLEDLPSEVEDNEPGAVQQPGSQPPPPTNNSCGAIPQPEKPNGEDDGGEMDMDLEEGEVSEEPAAETDVAADIAAAKARLLAQLDGAEVAEESAPGTVQNGTDGTSAAQNGEGFDEARSRANMRATLNMILTVAGEVYGQRDLLEFRDPFT